VIIQIFCLWFENKPTNLINCEPQKIIIESLVSMLEYLAKFFFGFVVLRFVSRRSLFLIVLAFPFVDNFFNPHLRQLIIMDKLIFPFIKKNRVGLQLT
jgi:hypothetical protein